MIWRRSGEDPLNDESDHTWNLLSGFLEQAGYRVWLPLRCNEHVLCAHDQWGLPKNNLGHHYFGSFFEDEDNVTMFHRKVSIMLLVFTLVGPL